jgi:PST family polysaccharide transporter/lipopolysaccharide exporter
MEFLKRVKKVMTPDGNVGDQAVKSGIWVGLINVSDRGFQLLKLVVLANLLSPKDFGLMGIALLALGVLKQFSQLGIDTALIQKSEENVDKFLNTAWTMKIARGLTLATIGYLVAPYIAQFFGEPRTTDLIRVICISPILLGLRNPGVMYLQKNLEFHRQFIYKLSGTLVDVTVAIGFALATGRVWALVFGKISGDIIRTSVSYLIHSYRPRLRFKESLGRELFGYGKWLMGSGAILFLIKQGDDAFVGWFLGASALGFYQVAYRLSNAPATEVSNVLQRVLLPTYSKIQDDTRKLRESYFKMVKLTSLVSIPMAVGILVITPVFVSAFLGSEWLPMVPAMQALALFGLIRSVGAIDGPLLMAIGRPDIATKMQFLHLIILAILIYPATAAIGILGTSVATTISILVPVTIKAYVTINFIEGSYRQYLRMILYPLAASGTMYSALLIVETLIDNVPPVSRFTLLLLSGVSIYAGLILVMDYQFGYRVLPIFREVRQAFSS